MDSGQLILDELKKRGFRMSRIRKLLVEILAKAEKPISAVDLLEKNKVPANKTTIYRELYTLVEQKVLREIDFGDGIKRYELSGDTHHHHLICTNCKKVEDIDLRTDLEKEEKQIEKDKGFKIETHSLEFFGLCNNCQQIVNR